jgi:hypothetical protein
MLGRTNEEPENLIFSVLFRIGSSTGADDGVKGVLLIEKGILKSGTEVDKGT